MACNMTGGQIGVFQVIVELCQRTLDRLGIPTKWALCIVGKIFKGNNDIWKCSCHKAMKVPAHEIKMVESMSQKRQVI